MMNQALTTEKKIQDLKDYYSELYERVHGPASASWVREADLTVEELEYMVKQYTDFFRHERARQRRNEEIRRKATAH